ncbi:hypothetical protein Pan54_41280 [Rubinisphaera italica]|uniref:Uncharacterized protein n=1 Tax=Rubinisphaera italica TaxID=2527969 RepID=A0A5C5XMQ1_9PLAN|nr:hypothetical protein Pan54_41280 [Rubinisphaera italica]
MVFIRRIINVRILLAGLFSSPQKRNKTLPFLITIQLSNFSAKYSVKQNGYGPLKSMPL